MERAEDRPYVTVDVALFTIAEGALRIAFVTRERAPFRGAPALIGGPIHPSSDTDTAAAAQRLVREASGVDRAFIEQLMTFSGPDRDPRGWSVSVAYYALVPWATLLSGKGAELTLAAVDRLPQLAFDHDRIVAIALNRLRGKSAYTSLPSLLLPPEFTFPELKAVYETVMGTALNDSAFRRKIGDLGIIEEVPEAKSVATAARRRPAQLYRLKHCALVEFDRTV